MPAPVTRTAPRRLSAADVMRQLSDAALSLAGRMDHPARSITEYESRVAEGERISAEVRRIVRG
jgi:hypothetical protein